MFCSLPELYHVRVHRLTQDGSDHIKKHELFRAGDRVGVAVSGGIDSVALLRLLMELRHELGIVVSVVHFNHKLRGAESDADQEFVAALAREHGLEFFVESGDAAELAAEEHSGIEAAARELRYEFFRYLLGEGDRAQGLEPEFDNPPLRGAEAQLFQVTANGGARLAKIATAHTLDDQAETVLMRMIRGTGTRGLGGIYSRLVVENENSDENDAHDAGKGHSEIVRPLLGIRRRELEKYLIEIKQPWREDASNAESKFTRNRVRKLLLPLIEREFNPGIVTNLSELAEIARDEEDYWANEISGWQGTVVQWLEPEWMKTANSSTGLVQIQAPGELRATETRVEDDRESAEESVAEDSTAAQPFASANCSVSRPWLLTEPKAVQRRVIKAIGEQAGIPLEFRHVEEILHFADEEGPAGKELALPLGWKVIRGAEAILFVTPDLRRELPLANYEYHFEIPGRVSVPELAVAMEALLIAPASSESSPSARLQKQQSPPDSRAAQDCESTEYNPQQLLDAKLVRSPLTVRNWRAGDRYWPAHTKEPKKIKELLQEKHIGLPQRKLWPVVVSGEEMIWMRGFPAPARFQWKGEGEAVLIREMVLRESGEF